MATGTMDRLDSRPGDRRRRRGLLAAVAAVLAVAALVAGGIAWWRATRPPDPRTAQTAAALHHLVTVGGPAGFTVASGTFEPSGTANLHLERREGLEVVIDSNAGVERGFRATWSATVPVGSASAECSALAQWMVRVTPGASERGVRRACTEATSRRPGDGPDPFASHATPIGPQGSYQSDAVAGPAQPGHVTLYALLSFDSADGTWPVGRDTSPYGPRD